MYQNYLITGATGFLGRAVVQLLLAHGCRVLALVKNSDPLHLYSAEPCCRLLW